MSETKLASTCVWCGQSIVFDRTQGKWVTGQSWHCGHDPLFPVRAHTPTEITEITEVSSTPEDPRIERAEWERDHGEGRYAHDE